MPPPATAETHVIAVADPGEAEGVAALYSYVYFLVAKIFFVYKRMSYTAV